MGWLTDFSDGSALRSCRREAGMTQKALAAAAGIHTNSVKYAERQTKRLRGWASERMRLALVAAGVKIAEPIRPFSPPASERRQWEAEWIERKMREAASRSALCSVTCSASAAERADPVERQPCGAKTRKGTSCLAMSVRGKKRCRLHGGLSTGPKTEAGRRRVAEAQRRRWENQHAPLA